MSIRFFIYNCLCVSLKCSICGSFYVCIWKMVQNPVMYVLFKNTLRRLITHYGYMNTQIIMYLVVTPQSNLQLLLLHCIILASLRSWNIILFGNHCTEGMFYDKEAKFLCPQNTHNIIQKYIKLLKKDFQLNTNNRLLTQEKCHWIYCCR